MNAMTGMTVTLLFAVLVAGCAGQPADKSTIKTVAAAKANTQLGVEYLRSGDYEMALAKLKRALELEPDYYAAHDAIAVLYEQVGDNDKAEYHYRRSLSIKPDHAAGHNNYGQFLCRKGRYDEAEKEFQEAAGDHFYATPQLPLHNAGICLLSNGDRAAAEEYLRQALARDPKYAPSLLQMSILSYEDGNYLGARAYLQRFQQVARHTAASLWLGVRTEYALGDHGAWGSYALTLKNKYPDSKQAALLQEWENERRSAK